MRAATSVATAAVLVACSRDGRAAESAPGPGAATAQSPATLPSPSLDGGARPSTNGTGAGAVDSGAPGRGTSGEEAGAGARHGAQAGSPTLGTPALVAHPDHIQAGLAEQRSLAILINPRERDPRALDEGKQLFVSYNCADCHGGEGSGGMGPSLQDGRWHFGGTPGDVYESISEGRPDGMPSWGGRISDSQIWALVRYVRTLSSGKNVTTESFEGAGTIARGGH